MNNQKKTFLQAWESRTWQQDLAEIKLHENIITIDETQRLLSKVTLLPITASPTQFDVMVATDEAGTVTIGDDPADDSAIGAKKVRFTPKRTATAVRVSKQELIASGINWERYVYLKAVEQIIAKAERQMLSEGTATGLEPNNFQSIIKTAELDAYEVEFLGDEQSGTFSEEYAKVARNALLAPVSSNAGVFWIIPVEQVKDVIKMGELYSAYSYDDMVDKDFYAKLFGKPVYNGVLGEGTEFENIVGVVMNKNGYGMAMSDFNFTEIKGDTTTSVAGYVTFLVENYMDGKVLDTNSIKLLGFTPPAPVEPVTP